MRREAGLPAAAAAIDGSQRLSGSAHGRTGGLQSSGHHGLGGGQFTGIWRQKKQKLGMGLLFLEVWRKKPSRVSWACEWVEGGGRKDRVCPVSVTPGLLELRGCFENNLEVSYIPLKNSLKNFLQWHLPALTIDNQNSNMHFGHMWLP